MSTYQVRSLEEADFIVKQHEKKTKTSYALLRSTKNFGCVDVPGCNNEEQEVRFDTVGVPYCGVPFFVAGLKILQCQSYKEKGSKALSKKKEIKIELPGACASVINSPLDQAMPAELTSRPMPPRKKKKLAGGRAPRSSCTATVILKEVIYYPEFQLLEHSRNNRLGVARQLKEVLRNRSPIQKDRIIYVTVPSHSDHFGHPVGQIVSKKIYLKNDYYGPVENTAPTQSSHASGDAPAKRLYFPVKEEKGTALGTDYILGLPMNCFEESVKGSHFAPEGAENRMETKAKEVRDLLQCIMAFTYKCADEDTMERLRQELVSLKQRFLERPKPSDKRPPAQQQLVLPDSGKREQQTVQLQPQQQQQQAVTVQTQPQIVLLKQSKSQQQQQQILQQQIVPRVVSGPRPIRLKGQQQQQQQPILQVQQMDNDPSTLSITINPVGAVASSSSLVSLSGATLSALPSVTSTVAGLSSGPLCTPSFTNIAGNTLHAMPIASIPTVSIAGNASSLPITTLPSFPTVVVPSAALQPSNVTLAIPAGSFSALSGALPAFSNGSTFPARSIASAASISLGSISTLQTGVLPSLQCSATSLPSIVAPVLSDIIMAPAAQTAGVSVSAVTNSPSFSSFTSGSQTASAQRVLTSISTNKSFMSANNRNVNNSSSYPVNISQSDVASSVSTTPMCSLPAGTIIPNLGVACLASPSNKNSGSPSHLTSVGPANVAVCTSVDGSPFSSNTSSVTCTWTAAAPVSLHVSSTCVSGVSSACDVASTRSSTSKPHSTSSQKKSSLMQDPSSSVLRDGYDPHHQQHQHRQLRSGLTSDDQRSDLLQSAAAAALPPPSVSLGAGVATEQTASDLKTSPAKTGAASAPSDAGNNQETSIFIEAMEAILNSHM